VEAIKLLAELGVNKETKAAGEATPLPVAAGGGHIEAIKLMVQLGAQLDAQTANRETALQLSVRHGHHQAAQALRQLERAALTQKVAVTSERAQQAAEQLDRNAAALIEEEEREQAAKAQSKVRVAPPSPHIGLHSVHLNGERCGSLWRTGGWRVARCRLRRSCGGASPLTAWCAREGGSQQKGKQQKGKAKAKDGAGGGPSNKAAAAGSSGEASTSRGEGSRPSSLPSGSAGHRSTVEDAVQSVLPSAEAASGTQQT
jgi:hypothetical protein